MCDDELAIGLNSLDCGVSLDNSKYSCNISFIGGLLPLYMSVYPMKEVLGFTVRGGEVL